MPVKTAPRSSLATTAPRLRRIRNTATLDVTTTHSHARFLASVQPVSSACLVGCSLTYSAASATGAASASLVSCSRSSCSCSYSYSCSCLDPPEPEPEPEPEHEYEYEYEPEWPEPLIARQRPLIDSLAGRCGSAVRGLRASRSLVMSAQPLSTCEYFGTCTIWNHGPRARARSATSACRGR